MADLVWPISVKDLIRIGRSIGPRPGHQALHEGLDLYARAGATVLSASAATVLRVVDGTESNQDSLKRAGLYVDAQESGGRVHRYLHLGGVRVRVGQWLSPGMQLGALADVGGSGIKRSQPHLHYEIRATDRTSQPGQGKRDYGAPLDPLRELPPLRVAASAKDQRGRLVELATLIWRGFALALPQLGPNERADLRRRVGHSDLRWVLSLVLAAALVIHRAQNVNATAARWFGLDGEIIAALMAGMGCTGVVGQAERFLVQDAGLDRKLTDRNVDGVATALVGWVQSLRGQDGLANWLTGADLRDAGWALVRRFPEPYSGHPADWGEVEEQ